MTLPLGSTAIIDLGNQRWALQDNNLYALSAIDRVEGPIVQITDFGASLQRVENVAAPKRYAAAILEKSLRDRGDTDGASKILLSSADTYAGTTRALYTAVSAERFNQYWQIANKHSDHYLLVPQLAMLLRKGQKIKDKNPVILFQHGYNIDLLLISDHKPVAALRVTASGSEQDDWERALRFLVAELAHLQNDLELTLRKAYWYDWDPEGVCIPEWICHWLDSNTELQIVKEEPVTLNYNGEQILCSLPGLLTSCHSSDAVNTLGSKGSYWGERVLPYAAMVMLSASAALFALSLQWGERSQENAQGISSLIDQINTTDLNTISHQLKQPVSQADDNPQYNFISRLHRAASLPPLPKVIADVRGLMPTESRITGLSLDLEGKTSVMILEGWISAEPVTVNKLLQQLIRDLNSKGYQVKDNGLLAQKQRNLFQLEITLDGASHEI